MSAFLHSLTDTAAAAGLLLLDLLDNWSAVGLLVALWLAVAGRLASGAGFANLFRDDEHVVFVTGDTGRLDRGRWRQRRAWFSTLAASPAFWSHLGLSVLGGVIWLDMRDATAAPGDSPWSGLLAAQVAVAAIGLGASWSSLRRPRLDLAAPLPEDLVHEMARCLLGAVGGGLIIAAFHWLALAIAGWLGGVAEGWLARIGGDPQTWLHVLTLVAVVVAFAVPYLVAGLAVICLALAVVSLVALTGTLAGPHAEIAAMGAVVLLIWANGVWYKGRIPGLAYGATAAGPKTAQDPNQAGLLRANPQKIDLIAPLEAWKARQPHRRPVLVLVATSGGAYRASFWTALVLDRIAAESGEGERFRGLPENIRLIAGASGGMVAGAYFTALCARDGRPPANLADAIADDTVAFQSGGGNGVFRGRRRRIPIPRDSLSPVVQQFIRRDLPGAFIPGPRPMDRGVTLENQWLTLQRSFADIAPAEAAGLCPSIVFTPMLIETGSVAFISNLDLKPLRLQRLQPGEDETAINNNSVEVLDAFPEAREGMTLATAVRLNATFPYVSPALSLPTKLGRRVVDSGYYDNYGGDVIAAWLAEPGVMQWIGENCSGVAIIQIRAFATHSEHLETPAARVARALQGITSPLEGLFSARAASQLLRNNQQLRLVEKLYEHHLGDRVPGRCQPFIRRFSFEAFADATMSWYLPDGELESLRRLLPEHADFSVRHHLDARSLAHPPGSLPALRRQEFENRQRELREEFDALAQFWASGCACS